MNKLEQLGVAIDARYLVKKGNDWYITDPRFVNRQGFFCVVAEWCGWCKKLAASMYQARSQYNVVCAYIDGDTALGKAYAQQMGVSGFPSIFTFDTTGKLKEYNGDRSPSALAAACRPPAARPSTASTTSGWWW